MLTQQQIEKFGDEFVPIFQKLEQEVIGDIARRVAKTGRWTETAELQATSLRELGYSPEEIKKEVLRVLKADEAYIQAIDRATLEYKAKIKQKIKETIKEARKKGDKLTASAGKMAYSEDLSLWAKAGKRLTKTGTLAKTIKFYQKQVDEQARNITKSLGFAINAKRVPIKDAFTNELNEAIIKISSGAFTKEQAVEDLMRRLTRSGLRKIAFNSGASRNIDTAARLAIQTTHAQMSAAIMMDNVVESGEDLVEVSHHAGARDEGIGCMNHASWQGKVYSISGKPHEAESQRLGYKIEKLADVTGYPDDPSGLCGFNCRHTFYVYFEGLSEPADKESPRPDIIWNGRTYNAYQARQKQRQLEREIRELKRGKALGVENLEARLLNKHIEYKKFCKAANLTPNLGRLKVYNAKDYFGVALKPEKAVEKPAKTVIKPEKTIEKSAKTERAKTNLPKTLAHHEEHLREYYANNLVGVIDPEKEQEFNRILSRVIDDSELSMRFHSRNLERLLEDGTFKNQFETGTSGGTLAEGHRRNASKNLFGHTGKGFRRKDYEKYGYVGHSDFYEDWKYNIENYDGVEQYGDVIIHFDKESLADRVTITVDNSLGNGVCKEVAAVSIKQPTLHAVPNGKVKPVVDTVVLRQPTNINEIAEKAQARYVEAQYHGEITLNDATDICFTGPVPGEAVLKELKSYGLELWRIENGKAIKI